MRVRRSSAALPISAYRAVATALSALLVLTVLWVTPAPAPSIPAQGTQGEPAIKVLVFHGSHDSVAAGIASIERAGRQGPADQHFGVDATSDPAVFTPARLARYNAVVFLSVSGQVLSAEQEDAFRMYVEDGGGFLGIHDTARAQPDSQWFTGLVGARPTTSPTNVQQAVVEVGDRLHPATAALPMEWTRSDVWFNWATNPSGTVHTVARVRERSYSPGEGADGWDHPISWCRDYAGGRSFYTGMGGTADSYREPLFRGHLRGALLWAARFVQADCKATIASNYEVTRLTAPNQPGQLDQIGEPHGLDIAADGRVFYIGRGGPMSPGGPEEIIDWSDPNIGKGFGTIHMWDPATEKVHHITTLDVFGHKGGGPEHKKTEEGLVGIALDPEFIDNGWMYLYYMPHASIDRENRVGKRTVSRFTFDHETNTLDLSSEQVIISWDAQIDRCCHVGGGLDFDADGNLYIAVGDNNSSQCDGCFPAPGGYSGNNPVPEFAGISQQDARRTAGNTNNLNGKILRIKPLPDAAGPPGAGATYAIPPGNLFTGNEQGGGKTRPEIYVMGVRNPTRLAVDDETGWLLAGWVGPDAGQPNATWGPAKYESIAAMTKAQNQGWPYCMGNRQPYRDRNLPDITVPLDWYDCDNLRNESPRNTGLVDIPPANPATMWYSPQGGGPDFTRDENGVPIYTLENQTLTMPYLSGEGGAQAVMPGPLYRYDASSDSTVKWPEYWDGKWFIGDFYDRRPRIAVMLDPRTGADGVLDAPVHVENLKSIIPTTRPNGIRRLMDWTFGPDGALYLLDYGDSFFAAHAESALWRVTYVGGPPTPAPEDLVSSHPRGNGYQWIFDGSAQSFAAWEHVGAGGFTLNEEGSGSMTSIAVPGLGMIWYPVQAYGDFSLKLQWRDDAPEGRNTNSGVFVRFPWVHDHPEESRPAWVAIKYGHEVQILDSPTGDMYKSGSIYGFDVVDFAGANPAPKGTWNDYEIRVVGQQYSVYRNGVLINEYFNDPDAVFFPPRGDDPGGAGRQHATGYIGLQNHGTNDVITFRNVRIKEL